MDPNDPTPALHRAPVTPAAARRDLALLSNRRYTTFVTDAGTGRSSFGPYALTRWSPDPTRDADGFFVYVQDLDRGTCWSATRRPCGRAEQAAVRFDPGRVTFVRRDDGVETRLEVCVADDDVELRRVTLVNHDAAPRRLRVTSYAEVVLHDP